MIRHKAALPLFSLRAKATYRLLNARGIPFLDQPSFRARLVRRLHPAWATGLSPMLAGPASTVVRGRPMRVQPRWKEPRCTAPPQQPGYRLKEPPRKPGPALRRSGNAYQHAPPCPAQKPKCRLSHNGGTKQPATPTSTSAPARSRRIVSVCAHRPCGRRYPPPTAENARPCNNFKGTPQEP